MTRYTVIFTDRPNSKARYRAALKMMGAQEVRIVESEAQAPTVKPRKDNTPTSPEAKAVADLFNRLHDLPWTDAEITLFKTARKTGALSLENMKLITVYYRTERAKNREGHHRRDLPTFLRNASGELDRAKAVKPTNGHALEWSDSRPKIVALPDPAEAERLARVAREGLEQFRKGMA